MPSASSRADQILDSAERMARCGGYNAFSFREIAKEIGIKAASVHYHFPGKAELGAALAQRYTERMFEALGDPEDPAADPDSLLEHYVAAYRASAARDGQMCLCGLLAAEIADLPGPVAKEARTFFARNRDWLIKVFERKSLGEQAKPRAELFLATLGGAVVLARSLEEPEIFDRAVSGLEALS